MNTYTEEKKIKVALINSVVGFGSTGRIVMQLAEMPGVDARIYYGRKKNNTGCDAIRITDGLGNARHALHTFLLDGHGNSNRKETERLLKMLEEFAPDVVHLHNLHGYYLNVDVLFSWIKERNIPVVWTLHDCWSFTGHCAYYDRIGCSQWKTHCLSCPGLRHYPPTFNGSHVKEQFDHKNRIFHGPKNMTLATPSRWLASEVQQSFLQDLDVRVIPNGIDLEHFRPTESNLREKYHLQGQKVFLACASVFDEGKGLPALQELSHHLTSDQTLVAIGVAEKEWKNFDSRVICIRRTDSITELAQWYSTADLFLNLTLEDNFPTVNLEALACGCPILTYPTGGCPEVIGTKTGAITERKDLTCFLKKLQELDLSAFDRKACHESAQVYSVKNMQERYYALYEEVLGYER